VALLLRSAEIQPLFGRFSDWIQNPITHTQQNITGLRLLEGGEAHCPDAKCPTSGRCWW